jgi:thiol:disulfide interchange protein DsbC
MKVLTLILTTGIVVGGSFSSVADETLDAIKSKTETLLKTQVSSVTASPVQGLYQVMTKRGLLYVTADARFMIQGTIYDLDNKLKNITEQTVAKVRIGQLQQYANSMIVFPANYEKHQITVFTDVDCGYCRRLHSQVEQYNGLGITIRYLAFPRGGEDSASWQKMQSIWCSKDQQQAMSDAKAGLEIAAASCDNLVPEHYQLGIEFGVNGTPSIILDDGTMIPGYQSPEQLSKILATRS